MPDASAAKKTVTMYRPVGPAELRLIEESGWAAFPPRLPEQPIFYPVENEEYARQIAREYWIPAEELAEFNGHIAGPIELIATYRAEDAGRSS